MRHDVREFQAVPWELVPPAIRAASVLARKAVEPRQLPRPERLRAPHPCQMMVVVDLLTAS